MYLVNKAIFFRQQIFIIAISLLLSLQLSGCGFHLRGGSVDGKDYQALSSKLTAVYISGNRYSDLLVDIGATFRAEGIDVKSSKTAGIATLQITNERFYSRVISIGSDGKVTEQEVTYFYYARLIDGNKKDLTGRIAIKLTRDYLHDQTAALGQFDEKNLLKTEMSRESAQTLMRRIRAKLL